MSRRHPLEGALGLSLPTREVLGHQSILKRVFVWGGSLGTKRCRRCGEVKAVEGFYRDKTTKDGLRGKCKDCMNQYVREWRAANPEMTRQQDRRQYWADPEKSRRKSLRGTRKWDKANPEKVRDRGRKWRAANRQKAREYHRGWRAVNSEKIAAIGHRRRARKLNAPGSHTAEEIRLLFEKYPACLCCGSREKLQADHVVALANGGSDGPENLQVLCGPCNSSKHAQTIDYRTSQTPARR